MSKNDNVLGYVKYDADYIKDGMFDARKSANALMSFDEIMRYFILKECPELRNVDFDFPVKIEEGSWGMFLPENIEKAIIVYSFYGLTGLVIKDYLTAIAKKAGSDGIFETGPTKDIKKIVIRSLQSIQWIIKIAKIRNKMGENEIEGAKPNISDKTVEIPSIDNPQNKLIVPMEFFEEYIICSKDLLSKLVSIVDERTELEIGAKENENEFMTIKITEGEKNIFYTDKEKDEIILPELEDGKSVALEGQITRGNEKDNSIGFLYNGHVLTCKPKDGRITKYKNNIISSSAKHLFPEVIISGVVERKAISGEFKEKRPRIIFENIEAVEIIEEEPQIGLNKYIEDIEKDDEKK